MGQIDKMKHALQDYSELHIMPSGSLPFGVERFRKSTTIQMVRCAEDPVKWGFL